MAASTSCKYYKNKVLKYTEKHKVELENKEHYRVVTLSHYKDQESKACNYKSNYKSDYK